MRKNYLVKMNISTFAVVFLFIGIFDGITSEREKCGIKGSPTGQILGGKRAIKNEWPWVANLMHLPDGKFFCAGTLIHAKKVLTAAHCIHDKFTESLSTEDIMVQLGRFDLNANEPMSKSFQPKEIIVHPDWNSTHERYDGDIAILLAEYSMESLFITPVCLTQRSLPSTKNVEGTITGWGFSSDLEIEPESVLKKVQVLKVPDSNCLRDSWKLGAISSERTFCVTGVEGGATPCKGDSGGGFYVEDNGIWFIHGIVSASVVSKNCPSTKHSILTDVHSFLNWIEPDRDEPIVAVTTESGLNRVLIKLFGAIVDGKTQIVEDAFSCNDPEGLAQCWHNDWRHRDARCQGCKVNRKFSFDYQFDGTCYCCQCN